MSEQRRSSDNVLYIIATIKANQSSLNQHLEVFYTSVLPAYNGLKPELEEYWLRTGGVLKYVASDEIFKSLSTERKFLINGTLAAFGMMAETEVINVPLLYAGTATGGQAKPELKQVPEKLTMPEDQPKAPEWFVTVGIIEIISIEITDKEISMEFNALISLGIKHNLNEGTTTLTAGSALDSGALVPGVSGGASESYYWTFKGTSLSDHGYISKHTKGVNAGIANIGTKYSETFTTKVSNVTSAVDRTVEKVVSGNFATGSGGVRVKVSSSMKPFMQ